MNTIPAREISQPSTYGVELLATNFKIGKFNIIRGAFSNTSLSFDPHYDELITSLYQIDALLDVVTSVDLTELKSETIPNYFWVISDLLHRAKAVCENLVNNENCPPVTPEGQANAN